MESPGLVRHPRPATATPVAGEAEVPVPLRPPSTPSGGGSSTAAALLAARHARRASAGRAEGSFVACSCLIIASVWAKLALSGSDSYGGSLLVHARMAATLAAGLALSLLLAKMPHHRQWLLATQRLLAVTLLPEEALSTMLLQAGPTPGFVGWWVDALRLLLGEQKAHLPFCMHYYASYQTLWR